MNNILIIKVKDCDIKRMGVILKNAFIRHGLEIVTITEEKDNKESKPPVVYNSQQNQTPPNF